MPTGELVRIGAGDGLGIRKEREDKCTDIPLTHREFEGTTHTILVVWRHSLVPSRTYNEMCIHICAELVRLGCSKTKCLMSATTRRESEAVMWTSGSGALGLERKQRDQEKRRINNRHRTVITSEGNCTSPSILVRMQADGLGLNPSVETETGGAEHAQLEAGWHWCGSTWEEGMGRYGCLEKKPWCDRMGGAVHGRKTQRQCGLGPNRHTERARGAKWMQDGTGRPAGLEETMAALGIPEEEERERTGDRGMGRDDMMGMCREAWDDGAGIWELDAGRLVPGGDDGAGMRGDLLGAGMWGCRDDGAGMWGGSFQAGDLLAGRQWGKCGKLGWTGLKAKF
ncbi:hypothetical protein B0H14DRAFT_2603130 [Mycena olivaceomarginata]|nr:hypothetical protein B0H14DRAFT_2603130 [Mycena olivaceomarginata]